MASSLVTKGRGLKRLADILWPLGKSTRMRWPLHILLVIAVIIILAYLNSRYFPLPQLSDNTFLQNYLWPLLFVLVYGMCMASWWMWKLLAFEQIDSIYTDIDAAWQEGMNALAQAGIRLTECPLFLIVGRPESSAGRPETSERKLFEAARLDLKVKLTPSGQAPLHVCADSDAVYVTCAGVSLLGRLAGILALEELPQSGDSLVADPVVDPFVTQKTNRNEEELLDNLDASASGDPTTLVRRRRRRLLNMAFGPNFLGDRQEVRKSADRLKHLCQLIARDRQPYCPINGVLVVLPLGGTDTNPDAQQTQEACQVDLAVIRSTLQMNCALFVLVGDMEVLPGFREFMRRQDQKKLAGRVGQRFSLAAALTDNELLQQARQSIRWLCNGYVRESVYQYFKVDSANAPDSSDLAAGNAALFLLLDEMHERSERLVGIISQFVARDENGGWMFGGCYLGATGEAGQQAFVHGLFKRLSENQNCVAWTPAALTNEASCHAQASWGCALVAAAWLAIAGAVIWMVWMMVKK